ncbi:MAG: undecaprenyl-diphosphate phosphatase [Candidatus Woesebacteria bacterium]
MNGFQAIVLGILEGVTEFLPVSSTAHLIVAQRLLGLSSIDEFFTVVVQLGAIAGLIVSERKKIAEIIIQMYAAPRKIQSSLGFKLALATIPVLLVGFLIKHKIEALQNNFGLIAFMSIAVSIVLLLAQKMAGKMEKKPVSTANIFVMGLFQVISLIPGTSRSGITAAGGAFQGLTLSHALEYSFLLSIPALLAAGGYEVLKFAGNPVDTNIIVPTLVATVIAFFCSMVAIEWLRKIVRQVGFTPFVVYRFFFALMILFIK